MAQKTPVKWTFPVELNEKERSVAKDLRRIGRFYVFLREIRHELFDDDFQAKLAGAYKPRGTDPKPPALLAMVTLLQAYTQTGDAEAVVTTKMDKRWQLVLGCLDCDKAPFSQGVLSQFRDRMIAHDMDQALLDRTVEIAKRTKGFGWQKLKAALDSSPLLGAGRVLDTWNLIGRALSTVVTCAAKALKMNREQVIREAGLTLLSAPSIKAALDSDWDDPEQRDEALARLLGEVDLLEEWVTGHGAVLTEDVPVREALEALRRVLEQDLDPVPPDGPRRIRRGTARDRMPSLGDPEMRHGRKSKAKPFTGYKRHFIRFLNPNIITGALALPANCPEQQALELLVADTKRHAHFDELHMDRAYLGSPAVRQLRAAGVKIQCKPWPSRNAGRFTKEDFAIDLSARTVRCPEQATASIAPKSSVARFPKSVCAACPQRASCTSAKNTGRTITIHPLEDLLIELRSEKSTPEGREALRERTAIEHSLARVSHIQGPKARYRGVRKNTLDERRTGVVMNLQEIARERQAATRERKAA
jgi:hypothetical protein